MFNIQFRWSNSEKAHWGGKVDRMENFPQNSTFLDFRQVKFSKRWLVFIFQ